MFNFYQITQSHKDMVIHFVGIFFDHCSTSSCNDICQLAIPVAEKFAIFHWNEFDSAPISVTYHPNYQCEDQQTSIVFKSCKPHLTYLTTYSRLKKKLLSYCIIHIIGFVNILNSFLVIL